MAEPCSTASTILGFVFNLLWQMEPMFEPLGLSPWNALAPLAVATFPANHGTGFFINDRGDFVTAHHVAGGCALVAVETPDGVRVGRPVAGSKDLDVTVVALAVTPPAYAVFPEAPPPPACELLQVVTTGRCRGLDSRTTAAAWGMRVAGPSRDALAILSAKPIVSGNSGSPVVAADGLLAGMLVAHAIGSDRNGIAVPAARIADVLQSAGIPFATAARGMAPPDAYTFPVDCFEP